MKDIWGRLVRKISSRVQRPLPSSDPGVSELTARVAGYEAEVKELRDEIDELRQDSLRIAELYDLVFERLKQGRS